MKKRIVLVIIVLIVLGTIVYLGLPKEKEIQKKDIEEVQLENSIVLKKEEKIEFEEGTLGILKIEKIELEAPVKEGSTIDVLKNYIGHIEETENFDGNIGLAAHNRGNEFSYFARLNELVEGDIVIYKSIYGTRTYKVDKIEVILETDWSNFANTEINKLTMITCISNRPTQRLCVQATQI